jgi:hypothetical protein
MGVCVPLPSNDSTGVELRSLGLEPSTLLMRALSCRQRHAQQYKVNVVVRSSCLSDMWFSYLLRHAAAGKDMHNDARFMMWCVKQPPELVPGDSASFMRTLSCRQWDKHSTRLMMWCVKQLPERCSFVRFLLCSEAR